VTGTTRRAEYDSGNVGREIRDYGSYW
jgi:hypothetical protein